MFYLFIHKSVRDVEKELSELHHKAEKLEKELGRIEMLERMQAQHEIILAKKIADINRFDDELRRFVKHDDLLAIHEELKKIKDHEDILAENALLMREIINELRKIKETHRRAKDHMFEKDHVTKMEFEDRLSSISSALVDLNHIRSSHKKKVDKEDLDSIRKELHERMSQLEYQNKLLMKYLKRIDELLQKKLEI